MGKKIAIEPVTRVEGHGKVTIYLDKEGKVEKAQFQGLEFRGFEKFCEGRTVWEMPVITTRICGTCPVSHHLASVKACEDLLNVKPPPTAEALRELMHMGQFIHNAALHFYFFSAPDLLFGYDAPVAKRNIVGIVKEKPELAKKAIKLRRIGQEIIEKVGGRSIHPVAAIPGGMTKPLSHEDRYFLVNKVKEASELATLALEVGKDLLLNRSKNLLNDAASQKTKFLGLVNKKALDLYQGELRLIDEAGKVLEEFPAVSYLDYIAEKVMDDSYLKLPYYKIAGWPKGIYRVGPLARVNVADKITTPQAQKELLEFKKIGNGKPVQKPLYYHYARLIELIYAVEMAEKLLEDDMIVSEDVRVPIKRRADAFEFQASQDEFEGVGVIEAPRGTLIHHYWADKLGKLTRVNLIVATVHNNAGMNQSVAEVAKEHIRNSQVSEEALNRIEMVIRAYDPCLSCSTHSIEVKEASIGGAEKK